MIHRHDVALTPMECSGYQCLALFRIISRPKYLSETLKDLNSITIYALLYLTTNIKMCNFFQNLFTAGVSIISEQPSYNVRLKYVLRTVNVRGTFCCVG